MVRSYTSVLYLRYNYFFVKEQKAAKRNGRRTRRRPLRFQERKTYIVGVEPEEHVLQFLRCVKIS